MKDPTGPRSFVGAAELARHAATASNYLKKVCAACAVGDGPRWIADRKRVTWSGDDVVGPLCRANRLPTHEALPPGSPLGPISHCHGRARRVDRSARMHQGGRAHPEIQSRLAGSERGAAQLVHAELIFRRDTARRGIHLQAGALHQKGYPASCLSLDGQHRPISKHHAEPGDYTPVV